MEDQCAVLCLLTHGVEDYIYGSDGRTLYLQRLLSSLDNIHCIQMANKPKVVVIQSCQGGISLHSVMAVMKIKL